MDTQKNNSFMSQIDLITLQADKTIEKIIYKLLLKLASGKVLKNGKSGGCNMDAYNILFSFDYNGLVTIEDLSQTMFLFLLEHQNSH